jgi:hypothetical protein
MTSRRQRKQSVKHPDYISILHKVEPGIELLIICRLTKIKEQIITSSVFKKFMFDLARGWLENKEINRLV